VLSVNRLDRANVCRDSFAEAPLQGHTILWRGKVSGKHWRSLAENKLGNLGDVVRGQRTCHANGNGRLTARTVEHDQPRANQQHKAGDY
jgi:hypothetical protein